MVLPLCVKVNTDDARSIKSLEGDGYRFIGTLSVYRGLAPHLDLIDIKSCYDPLKRPLELAREIRWSGRLWRDKSLLGTEVAWCETVKTIENPKFSCYTVGTGPAAFIIWDKLRVVLIGVHPIARGLGLARQLLCKDPVTITAGTYSDNESAIKLYESLGMKPINLQAVFHK